MFHLDSQRQLRVCGKIMRQDRNRVALANARILLLHHVLPTTEEFVSLLKESGAEIFAFVTKPFSIDKRVLARFKDQGLRVIQESYEQLENSDIIPMILHEAIDASINDQKKILILEVGGYFAKYLTKLTLEERAHFAGVVEDTTFGHNRYEKLVDEIMMPVVSVAKSPLKELEARFVGRDAVLALDLVFRELGISLVNRAALVIGYGMIGKNLAGALRDYKLQVSVYDILDHKMLLAFGSGYSVHKKSELIRSVDIVLSVTGDEEGAISLKEIEMCKDNVVLASVGSKDTEFDLKALREEAVSQEPFGEFIIKYKLPSDKNVFVLKNGTAINFILNSVPAEIIDLLFAEVTLAAIFLLKDWSDKFTLGKINYVGPHEMDYISKQWIKYINH